MTLSSPLGLPSLDQDSRRRQYHFTRSSRSQILVSQTVDEPAPRPSPERHTKKVTFSLNLSLIARLFFDIILFHTDILFF